MEAAGSAVIYSGFIGIPNLRPGPMLGDRRIFFGVERIEWVIDRSVPGMDVWHSPLV